MILLTTSRKPTNGMRTFCRDLARCIPNVVRINRGKLSIFGIAGRALSSNADKAIIVDRWKGGLGRLRFFNVNSTGLKAVPPLIYVSSIQFQRTLKKAKVKPVHSLAIALSSEKSKDISKIAEFLSDFLEVPTLCVEEALLNYQAVLHVSSNDAQHIRITFLLLPEKVEIGPRVTVPHVVWKI